MSWGERMMFVIGVSIVVVGLSLLARRVAIEMDELGWPGWVFGTLILVLPPVGALLWLTFRQAAPRDRRATSRRPPAGP